MGVASGSLEPLVLHYPRRRNDMDQVDIAMNGLHNAECVQGLSSLYFLLKALSWYEEASYIEKPYCHQNSAIITCEKCV